MARTSAVVPGSSRSQLLARTFRHQQANRLLARKERGKSRRRRHLVQPLPAATPDGGPRRTAPRMNLAGVTRNPNAVSSAPNPDKPPGDASTPKDAEKGKKKHEPVRNPHETDPAISAPNTPAAEAHSEREGATVRSRAREPKKPASGERDRGNARSPAGESRPGAAGPGPG